MSLENFLGSMPKSTWKKKKRSIGRGYGSGIGRTSGKGHKGQRGRGRKVRAGFEGGQTPAYRRLPQRGGTMGTNSRFNKIFAINAKFIDIKVKGEVNEINLVKAFRIPFYYKRIKVIGEGKDKYKEFISPVKISKKQSTK